LAPAAASPSPAAMAPRVEPPGPCGYGPTARLATVENGAVREASALAASRRAPGVYWTLNDSGNEPLLFAFDASGRNLGTFRVDGARNVDWEALQVGPRRDGGFALYIGDSGDNDRIRRESAIYRVPEPDVTGAADKPISSKTAPAE